MRGYDVRVGVYIDDEVTVTKRLHYTLLNFACVNNVCEREVNNNFSKHYDDPSPTA